MKTQMTVPGDQQDDHVLDGVHVKTFPVGGGERQSRTVSVLIEPG